MAASSTLAHAVRLMQTLDAYQSQGSLASQARDCAPVVAALGYYDLADYLRAVGERAEPAPVATIIRKVTEYGFARICGAGADADDGARIVCVHCDARFPQVDGAVMRSHARHCPVEPRDFPTPGVCDA